MKRACLYPRVSSPIQVKNGQSLENQERKLLEKALALGYTVDPEDIYTEPGITGKNDNRPQYNRMLAAIIEGRYDACFAYDISRLTRTPSREEQGRIIRVLAESKCDLYTDGAHYDLTNPESRFLFGIGAEVALLDNSQRAKKVREGRQGAREKGKNPGQPPSRGYVKFYQPDGKLVYRLDEKEAAPVRLAYQLALQGSGGTRILQELTRQGFRTKTGRPLSLAHVYQWLRNPTYAGYVHIGMARGSKAPEKGMWPATFLEGTIVTLEKWNQVQALLNLRKTNTPPTRFPLSGILTCPSCGELMVGTYKRGGQGNAKTRYYACLPPANEERICPNTQGRSIMMSVAHKLIIDALPEVFQHLGETYEMRMLEHYAQQILMEKDIDIIGNLQNELSALTRKIRTSIEINSTHFSETREMMIREWEQEVKTLRSRIQQEQRKLTPPELTDPRMLLDFLPNLDPSDMEGVEVICRPLFTKLHYSRAGSHRRYTFSLNSAILKGGESLLLKGNYEVRQEP